MINEFNLTTKMNRELREDARDTFAESWAAQCRMDGRAEEREARLVRRHRRWNRVLDVVLGVTCVVEVIILAMFAVAG